MSDRGVRDAYDGVLLMAAEEAANGSAAKRPHGSKTCDHVLVLVDDIGNLGKNMKEKGRRVFGFGVSIVEDPDKYAAVSKGHKERYGGTKELKARKVSRIHEKSAITNGIRKSGAKNYGYYVDKSRDTPKGWDDQNGSDIQTGMLRKTLDLTLPDISSDNVTVIVDDHTAYHSGEKPDRVKAMSESLSKEHGKNITCRTGGKKNDPYAAHLETADFVSHAIKEWKEDGDPRMSFAIGQKLRRFGKDDDISARE